MNTANRALSVIAFFLSEYDMDAVKELGFKTRTEAIKSISERVGNGNNYLKLRRDEFDALPDSSSSRKGWRNRLPSKEVVEMAAYLHHFSFDELKAIVKSLIGETEDSALDNAPSFDLTDKMDEEEIERLANMVDSSARLVYRLQTGAERFYNRSIIIQLKNLYRGCCQICGLNPVSDFETNICEAHHIDFFSDSQNNNADNIIILCPNHHRLIHKLKLKYDSENMAFYNDGKTLQVKLDFHLKRS